VRHKTIKHVRAPHEVLLDESLTALDPPCMEDRGSGVPVVGIDIPFFTKKA
jgi:hypothetical protein